MARNYPETPDGRYFVSRSELRRKTNPKLDGSTRRKLIKKMMQARRAMQLADNEFTRHEARMNVIEAKTALGETGPVWWDDGAPDESRTHPANSSYAEWWKALPLEERQRGG